jgi:hypothetical protein
MAKDIKISEVAVVEGKALVTGTVGEETFTATQLQWGGKVLMHVTGGDFDRGTRISIGHAAKKAVRAQGIDLTPAPLKRPRKAAEVVTEEAPSEPVVLADITFDSEIGV